MNKFLLITTCALIMAYLMAVMDYFHPIFMDWFGEWYFTMWII